MPTNGVDPRVLHKGVSILLLRQLEPFTVSDCAARYRSYCAAGVPVRNDFRSPLCTPVRPRSSLRWVF